MKVADLFALLRIKIDPKSMKKAQDSVGRFAKKSKGKFDKLEKAALGTFARIGLAAAAAFATRDALGFSKSLERLGITAKGGLGTLDEMQKKILAISNETGIAKEEVLSATSKFVELTGNVDIAASSMALFAKVTQATGASADDVAGSAAALSEQFKISSGDFEKMFSILIEGGKAGSAEFKDMAAHLAGIGAASQKFAGSTGIIAAAEISAALQIVAGSTGGNVAEATTQIKALFIGLGQASKKLKENGVQVFDTSGEYRELSEIFKDIKDKQFSAKEIEELFPNVRAQRGALALLRGDWEGLTQATLTSNAVAEDFAKIQKNNAVKVQIAWNKFKNFFTKLFLKVVDVLAAFTENIDILIVALTSLATAFAIVKVQALLAGSASVSAGLAAARAWIIGMAPLIIMALLIAALILIIEDIWVAFQGGESVFKDAHTWLVNVFVEAIEFWVEQFEAFFGFLEKKFNELKNFTKNIVTDIALGVGVSSSQKVIDRLREIGAENIRVKNAQARALASQQATLPIFGPPAPGEQGPTGKAAARGNAGGAIINAPVTITGVENPEQVAAAVTQAMERVARFIQTEGGGS